MRQSRLSSTSVGEQVRITIEIVESFLLNRNKVYPIGAQEGRSFFAH